MNDVIADSDIEPRAVIPNDGHATVPFFSECFSANAVVMRYHSSDTSVPGVTHSMQKISSSKYPLTRLLLPLLPDMKRRDLQLGIAAVVITSLATGLWMLLLPLLLPAGLLVIIHNAPNVVFQNFCQDAWADETGFLVRLKEQEISIPFDQVQTVTWHGSNNPPRARITLKTVGPHGSVFTFVPDLTEGRGRARKMVEAFNARVAQ